MFTSVGQNSLIHESVLSYGENHIGDFCIILEKVILGYPATPFLVKMRDESKFAGDFSYFGCRIGDNTIIRSESIIYQDVRIGQHSRTGHKILIREGSVVGDNSLIGTNVVIDSNVSIGNHVSIQSSVYVPTNTIIGDYVFLGPNCVLLNDKAPVRDHHPLIGPRIHKGATIGGNATLLPGVEIGEGAFIAAGSIVTQNVPPWTLAKGVPAKFYELPNNLSVLNKID